jgi:hypothetical protein
MDVIGNLILKRLRGMYARMDSLDQRRTRVECRLDISGAL